MVKSGSFVLNEMKDGYKPCCAFCGQPYPDGEIGDVKNYPADGLVSVFFTCEKCGKESEFLYEPYKPLHYLKKEASP